MRYIRLPPIRLKNSAEHHFFIKNVAHCRKIINTQSIVLCKIYMNTAFEDINTYYFYSTMKQ